MKNPITNNALFTDFYELTMAQGYWKNNMNHAVVFDMFFRRQPFNGGFSVFAGLENLIDAITDFTFGDEDIEYLQQTVSKVLDLLIGVQILDINSEDETVQEKVKAQIGAVNGIKGLISKDVLKTMQLLGFNYKAAIGEPLTELCANKIKGVANYNLRRKR